MALGSGCLIKPDIVITREPEEDEAINRPDAVWTGPLPELQETLTDLSATNSAHEHAADQFKIMVEGNRLRDIADLPLDLAV